MPPIIAPTQGTPQATGAATAIGKNIGTYQGVPVTAGTDAQVAAQMQSIDKQKATQPAVLSSQSIDQKNQQNVQTTQAQAQTPTGQSTTPEGFVMNADGSFAEAPSDAVSTLDPSTGKQYWSKGGMSYAAAPTAAEDPYMEQFRQLKATMDATGAAQMGALQGQYAALIEQQKQINRGAEAGVSSLLIRGGSEQTASSSGIMQAQVSYGLQQISDLVAKENSAIITAQQALADNDFKLLDKIQTIAADARKARQDAAQKIADSINTARAQQYKDSTVGTLLSQGFTSPSAMLGEMKKQGITGITAKDITDTLATLQPAQKEIAALMQTATNNGAPKNVIQSIGRSGSLEEAYNAAGQYGMTKAGVLYKAAQGSGYSGSANDFINAVGGNPDTAQHGTGAQGDILSNAGLSIGAFNFLTQGVSSMSRMPIAQRNAIMAEAQTWARNKGVDLATFQSQYKALNETLAKNLQRRNQTQIMAGEVSGSADALISAIDPKDMGTGILGLGPWKTGNIAALLAGKEVNDPKVMKYSTQLQLMGNDLAGYLAASRGDTAPTLTDQKDAANIISNGLNKGSVQAFKESIQSNEEKVNTVVGNAVDSTNKQVWQLFGVGDKYQTSQNYKTLTQVVQDDKQNQQKIASWVTQSASNKAAYERARTIFPNASTQELMQQLGI